MQLFVSRITKRFSLRAVGKELGMHQALAYRACRQLIEDGLIIKDDDKYVLNYKENHQELAYIESLRAKEVMGGKGTLFLLAEDIIKRFPFGYFSLIIFGSTVTSKRPRDLDLMVIIEKTEEIESAEKALYNITRNYTVDVHSLVLSFESVYEMLSARDEANVMTEVLDKHIILYGGELFYRLLTKGRR